MNCNATLKKTFCILLLLVSTLLGENYYVSKSYGNNNNDGKSVSSPFKTIAKAASVMTAGDVCYIREGSYHETITINNKDGSQGSPIVFTRYNNERVILDGTLPIDTSWTVHSGNIYKKKLSFTPWQLFVGGLEQVMARWPNAKFSDESIWDNDNHWAKGTIDDDENAYSNGTMIDDPYTNDQGESINLSSQGFDLDQTNKEAIAIAREHGDLKENSEYKMARQDQDLLLSRKNELEVSLSTAKVTDFSEANTEMVGIGNVVTLKEGSTGTSRKYSILGAWDSDPDNNVLSYKTPLAQSIIGKKINDTVSTSIDGNEEQWTILSIELWLESN